MIVLGNAGFMLAQKLYHIGKDKIVIVIALIGAFLTVLPFIVKWSVWMDVGTFADINNASVYSFWDPPFFYGWLVSMSYLVITTIIAGFFFKNQT